MKPYLLYIGMFVSTIYCNMKALQYSNVETLIVFRACCILPRFERMCGARGGGEVPRGKRTPLAP